MLINYSECPYEFANLTGWALSTGLEYFYTSNPYHEPMVVRDGATALSEGTVGSLSTGEWGYGTPTGGCGYDTIVVRLASAGAPTTGIDASMPVTLFTVAAGEAVGIMSIEIKSDEAADAKNVKFIRTSNAHVAFFDSSISIPALDTVILDHAICMASGERFKVMADSELIGVVINANEVS